MAGEISTHAPIVYVCLYLFLSLLLLICMFIRYALLNDNIYFLLYYRFLHRVKRSSNAIIWFSLPPFDFKSCQAF